jgi:hypothetical protein
MAGLMMLLTILGLWFLISALMDWEWWGSVIDLQSAELLFGENSIRWIFGVGGAAMVIIGLAGAWHAR